MTEPQIRTEWAIRWVEENEIEEMSMERALSVQSMYPDRVELVTRSYVLPEWQGIA